MQTNEELQIQQRLENAMAGLRREMIAAAVETDKIDAVFTVSMLYDQVVVVAQHERSADIAGMHTPPQPAVEPDVEPEAEVVEAAEAEDIVDADPFKLQRGKRGERIGRTKWETVARDEGGDGAAE